MWLAFQSRLPFRLFVQTVLLLFGLCLVWSGHAGEPGPLIPKGRGDNCVADTDFMRRNHMDLIVHQRDETLIRGIREEPFSLVECVDCHAQQNAKNEPLRIDADGQFCASCHSYAAVKIDCFGCHAAVPDVNKLDKLGSLDNTHWLPHKQMLAFKPASSTPLKSTLNSSLKLNEDSLMDTQLKTVLPRDRYELIGTK